MKPLHGVLLVALAAASRAVPTMGSLKKRATGKAGIAWNNPSNFSIEPFENSAEVGWYYTWSPWMLPNVTGLEFVPMYWGTPQIAPFTSQVTSQTVTTNSIKAILGMNEPDQAGQANMTAGVAASQWKTYLEPFKTSNPDIRLGSPAVVNDAVGLQWLYDFFGACGTGCTVDFLAIHWYGLSNTTDFIAYVNKMHDLFQKPIWVTEWACQNFGNQDLGQCSLSSIETFLAETQTWMDATDWVERYSWLGSTVNVVGLNQANNLLDDNGALTQLGQQYITGSEGVPTGSGTGSNSGSGGSSGSGSTSGNTTDTGTPGTGSLGNNTGIAQGGGLINSTPGGLHTVGWAVGLSLGGMALSLIL